MNYKLFDARYITLIISKLPGFNRPGSNNPAIVLSKITPVFFLLSNDRYVRPSLNFVPTQTD